ncbi:hypothetical protein D0A34_26660 [Microcoleus vaginatus PCC 9802]|nr:hypothetical protein D0A34_26660 [Microcoleus vaginatus PCC 9802]
MPHKKFICCETGILPVCGTGILRNSGRARSPPHKKFICCGTGILPVCGTGILPVCRTGILPVKLKCRTPVN